MPKFFVPAAADSTKAEEVYADLRSRAEKMRGGPMSERRIFRIDFAIMATDIIPRLGSLIAKPKIWS